MTDENKEEAKRLAKQAAREAEQAAHQAEQAGKDTGKALRVLAEPAIENAEELLDKTRGTAEDAVHAAAKLDFGRVLSKASAGFLALSAASFCGAVGYRVFIDLKNRPNA